jgi:hypothetical protein
MTTSTMVAQLHGTCMIGTTYRENRINHKNLPVQLLELQRSPSQASMLKVCNNFSCMNVSDSKAISSLVLATNNHHARLNQVHINL